MLLDITIIGVSELLMTSPNSMAVISASKKKTGVLTSNAYVKACLYLNDNGELCIPIKCLRASFVSGGKFFKVGPRSGMTALLGGLFPAHHRDMCILYGDKDHPITRYEKHTESCCIGKNSSSRVLVTRPMIPLPWRCTGKFMYDEDVAPLGTLEDSINMAGDRLGVLAYRAEKTGLFGRYKLEKIEVIEE